MGLIAYSLSLSLFDCLSTAQQVVLFALLLTSARPVRNALTYLSGVSGTYIICGVVGCQLFGHLQEILKRLSLTPDMSDLSYHQTELFGGLAMALLGIWYFRRHRAPGTALAEDRLMARFGSAGSGPLFALGAFVSITTFPVSIPYLLALGKYAALRLSVLGSLRYILVYNLGYAFPMLALLAAYLLRRQNLSKLPETVTREKVRRLNVHLTSWTLVATGALAIVDSGSFLMLGHALIKGRLL